MTEVAQRLKDELLRLPNDDRAELANILWESLDEEAGDAAWVEELNRRTEDLVAGRATAEPADQVFAELRAEAAREKLAK